MLLTARNLINSDSRPGLMPGCIPGMGSRGFTLTCSLSLCFYCPMLFSTYDFTEQHFADSSEFVFQIYLKMFLIL